MIKAVLFDLDGTLVNSLADLADSTNYALSLYGCPIHNTEEYKYFVGDGIPKLIERALPEGKRSGETKQAVLAAFLKHYKEHFADKTVAYDGINELLSRLEANRIKTAVVSNKAQEMAQKVVHKIFTHKFDTVFGKREGVLSKPDPTSVITVAAEMGLKAEECLLAGDSGMDAAAAKNAGCTAVGVLWGFRTEEELLKNGADYTVKAPEEIINIIKELNP